MRRCAELIFCLLVTLGLSTQARGQALVRLVIPPCAEPGATVWLDVQVQLQAGQTLKSYDIRIPHDVSSLSLREDLIQQGAWFQSGGPTFFWHDVVDGVLIVNGAILGPGLCVTGAGTVFRLPAEINTPQVADLGATIHDLYNVSAQLLPSLALPAALQAPCTAFNLRVDYLRDDQAVRLEWDPQNWTQAYRIYVAEGADQPWQLAASTSATQWTDPVDRPRRIYRVRSLFTSSR